MTEFGAYSSIAKVEIYHLPDIRAGNMASRKVKPEVRVFRLQFSPTGQAWAAVTIEDLLIYSLDIGLMFDPFELEFGVTSDTVKEMLEKQDYAKALMMALKLNEQLLTQQVLEAVPYKSIGLTTTSIHRDVYIEKLLKFIASELQSTRHIHFYLLWIKVILTKCGSQINTALQMPVLLMLQKNMQKKYNDLSKMRDFNQYMLNYILNVGELKSTKDVSEHTWSDSESDNDDSINILKDSSTDLED